MGGHATVLRFRDPARTPAAAVEKNGTMIAMRSEVPMVRFSWRVCSTGSAGGRVTAALRRGVLVTLAALALVVLGAAPSARADVPSPDVEACGGKAVGQACGPGRVCQTDTCSRGRPGPDGQMQISSWECVRCVEGAAASGGGGGGSTGLIAGIVIGVLMVGGGVYLAYRKSRR